MTVVSFFFFFWVSFAPSSCAWRECENERKCSASENIFLHKGDTGMSLSCVPKLQLSDFLNTVTTKPSGKTRSHNVQKWKRRRLLSKKMFVNVLFFFFFYCFCEFGWEENEEKKSKKKKKDLDYPTIRIEFCNICMCGSFVHLWLYARFGIWVYVSKGGKKENACYFRFACRRLFSFEFSVCTFLFGTMYKKKLYNLGRILDLMQHWYIIWI